MKVLRDDEGNFVIYLLMKDLNFHLSKKEELVKLIKTSVLKVNEIYRLNLKGFYKVRVYFHSKVGCVLELIPMEDIGFSDTLDLRVIIYFNQKFYFEVENFDFLPPHKKIIFINDKYYVDVDSLKEKELFSLFEFGQLIYREDLVENLFCGKTIFN